MVEYFTKNLPQSRLEQELQQAIRRARESLAQHQIKEEKQTEE